MKPFCMWNNVIHFLRNKISFYKCNFKRQQCTSGYSPCWSYSGTRWQRNGNFLYKHLSVASSPTAGRVNCQLVADTSLLVASALSAQWHTTYYRSCHLQLVLTIVRHRRWKITTKSFCNTEAVQPGASVHGLLCVAQPGVMYWSGIHHQRRAGVSLVQCSTATWSLPVENPYLYLYLKWRYLDIWKNLLKSKNNGDLTSTALIPFAILPTVSVHACVLHWYSQFGEQKIVGILQIWKFLN